MVTKRIGNDVRLEWELKYVNGDPEDLLDVDNLKVEVRHSTSGKKYEQKNFTLKGDNNNIIKLDFIASEQMEIGIYEVFTSYLRNDSSIKGGIATSAWDKCNVFKLVEKSCDLPTDDGDITIVTIIEKGDKGDSAYKVWLEEGNTGTEEDYFAYLQKPATDAIGSIQAVEQTVSENESLRITSETGRKDAENLRLSAEVIRIENETERVSKENIRNENEVTRVSNENTRVENEDTRVENEELRQSAETLRLDAELLRNSGETGRVNAEGLRVTAENERAQAEGERGLRETARNTAESERLSAEIIRQSNEGNRIEDEVIRVQNEAERISKENVRQSNEVDRVNAENLRDSAETDRVELYDEMLQLKTDTTTAKNDANNAVQLATNATIEAQTATQEATTAASLADTARLAIQDDLALKANQTDLAQLAGDVGLFKEESNLKDAIQNSKIKEIENVLSTANLNQSAQLSVSGVSPLSLPKNAANGGMSVKLGGLTENVGGVITHFEPTGRIRSDIGGRNLIPSFTNPIWGEWNNEINVLPNKISRNTLGLSKNIYADLELNTNYTLRIESNVRFTLRFLDKEGKTLSSTTYGSGSEGTPILFNTEEDIVRLQIFLNPNSAQWRMPWYYQNIKLEKGTVATDWTPPPEDVLAGIAKGTGTSLYLTAPELRSNGAVKDEIRKGGNGYELVKRISDVDGSVLTPHEIIPISYGGVLNSAENGTVYHEPVIADAGVYGTKMDILSTDYPIATIVEIIKHENGVDTYLDVSTAVITSDGLSFTHPDLTDGDLVLFTYAFDNESTNGNITATFYDSNVVKIDTATGKAYKIEDVITNGVLTRTLTEV